jgi:hypothetical protein
MSTPEGGSVFDDDPFGSIKKEVGKATPEPRLVNSFHFRSDVDSGVAAQHHTLGISRNQASPGDHVHDGSASRKLGSGQGLAISGSKGGNAALASLIAMLSNFIDFDDNTT